MVGEAKNTLVSLASLAQTTHPPSRLSQETVLLNTCGNGHQIVFADLTERFPGLLPSLP